MGLSDKKCPGCDGATPVLSKFEVNTLLKELNKWRVENDKFLIKTFAVANFAQALELANKFGVIAEEEGHHPDLLVRWGELSVKIWTHAVDGLTESDFILAAKFDRVT